MTIGLGSIFFIPEIEKLLRNYTAEKISQVLGVRQRVLSDVDCRYYINDPLSNEHYCASIFNKELYDLMFNRTPKIPWRESSFDSKTDNQIISHHEIARRCLILSDLLEKTEEIILTVSKQLDVHRNVIEAQEKSIDFMNI